MSEEKVANKAVENKIKGIIADQLAISPDLIKPELSLTTDLGADSLDLIELIMTLEEEIKSEITDEVGKKIKTVEDVIKFIELYNARGT